MEKRAKVHDSKTEINESKGYPKCNVKSRPIKMGGDVSLSEIKHKNPRLQKQLDVAAAKFGKLKYIYGDKQSKEQKKKKKVVSIAKGGIIHQWLGSRRRRRSRRRMIPAL